MKIAIIGTNGFLSNQIGKFCNENNIDITCYGIAEPTKHLANEFKYINLVESKINGKELAENDIVIYTSGAGIQSNLKESYDLIYKLNTYTPIDISCRLAEEHFKGTFITFGSYFEIGNNQENRLFDESALSTSLLETPNHYCLSKRLLTRFVSSTFAPFKHLHIVLPTIYGYGEAPHRIIPYTINAIKNNTPQLFTSGYQIRQYLYAGDIPKILIDLVNLGASGIINLPGVEVYSIRELINNIYNSYGKTVEEEQFGKAERADIGMQDLKLDGSLINSLLPNAKYTLLKDALKNYE